ncbi:MAG: c-type cytochrome [Planctomycetota bacterium]|jgi:mono/diheme cytochrome c family protein
MNSVIFRVVLVLAVAGLIAATVARNTGRVVSVPAPNSTLWEDAVGPYLPPSAELLARGEEVYLEQCEMCHGARGEGDGSGAYFLKTKPRNFATRTFKFRTTMGGMPADLDLFRSVTVGFEAYGMPSFRKLSIRDRWAVVHYVKSLAEAGTRRTLQRVAREAGEDFDPREVEKRMQAGTPFELPPESPPQPGDRALGRALFEKHCVQCHGREGRGDGTAATEQMKDNWGRVIRPRDMRAGRRYRKAGWRTRDVARVISLGIPGTPMPRSDLESARELWALARFVQFLSGEAPTE